MCLEHHQEPRPRLQGISTIQTSVASHGACTGRKPVSQDESLASPSVRHPATLCRRLDCAGQGRPLLRLMMEGACYLSRNSDPCLITHTHAKRCCERTMMLYPLAFGAHTAFICRRRESRISSMTRASSCIMIVDPAVRLPHARQRVKCLPARLLFSYRLTLSGLCRRTAVAASAA